MPNFVIIQPNGTRIEKEKDSPATLEELQDIVGGYIEVAPVPYPTNKELQIIVNENGAVEGLPQNFEGTEEYVKLTGITPRFAFSGPMVFLSGKALVSNPRLKSRA
jgi:hypothetical protein